MIKKVFLMLGIAAMLASCSQNEELFSDKGNNTVQQVTFTLATDEKPPNTSYHGWLALCGCCL